MRELENAVERAVVLSRNPVIGPDDLPDTVRGDRVATAPGVANGSSSGNGHRATIHVPALEEGWTPTPLTEALEEPEKQILLAALNANDWNRQVTAKQLDINRTTLYKKIKQYRLDEPG